ncbi:MAG: glycosyltransferase [Gemmatimonadaceae bacterium]
MSVIVNNYNYGRFLRDAVESALAQSYPLVQLIVVDDGSTDNSRDIIASYGDSVVAVLKDNAGQASAFNAGFAASRGSVVLFLDADDVLAPDVVERAVDTFSAEVVKVHWPLLEVDGRGMLTGKMHPRAALGEGDMRATSIEAGPMTENSPPTSGNAWSREFLERVFPIPEEEFRINADGYLLSLAWIYGKVAIASDATGFYRVHGQNHFASKTEKERRDRHHEKFHHQCHALQLHLLKQHVKTVPDTWKRLRGIYPPEFDEAAKRLLDHLIPPTGRFILVDENSWAEWWADGSGASRKALPFLEHEGVYWGRPANDADAIREVERLREQGADYVVFPWFTQWYLDKYPIFAKNISRRFKKIADEEMLVVFDMRAER